MATARGRFIPKNPQKYAGNANNIMFRSSWEVYVMKFLDSSETVIKWGSEEIAIPYLKPVINTLGQATFKVANYYPDFVVVYKGKDGAIIKEILEVKPLKEATSEKAKNAYDKLALVVNVAKWKAAEDFATKNGMKFRVLTEQSLFRSVPKKPRAPAKPRISKGKK